jgi:acyl carrier protein
MPTIADKVLGIVSKLEWWPRRPKKITLDTEFHRDLGADGLELVELVTELEDEFVLEIPEEAWIGWVTVRDAVLCVIRRTDIEQTEESK